MPQSTTASTHSAPPVITRPTRLTRRRAEPAARISGAGIRRRSEPRPERPSRAEPEARIAAPVSGAAPSRGPSGPLSGERLSAGTGHDAGRGTGSPRRVDRAGRRDQRRRRRAARRVRVAQRHPALRRQPVLLAGVAAPARRDDVVPRVRCRRGSGARRGRGSRRCSRSTGSGARRGRTRPGARAARWRGTARARSARAGSPTGTGTMRRSERNSAPLRCTISAFSLSTSTTARRDDTTHSGSKLAFSKSARATAVSTSSSCRRQSYRRARWQLPAHAHSMRAHHDGAGASPGTVRRGTTPGTRRRRPARGRAVAGRTRSRSRNARYSAWRNGEERRRAATTPARASRPIWRTAVAPQPGPHEPPPTRHRNQTRDRASDCRADGDSRWLRAVRIHGPDGSVGAGADAGRLAGVGRHRSTERPLGRRSTRCKSRPDRTRPSRTCSTRSRARSRPCCAARGARSTSRSCACSPKVTSSSRTCPASARRRSPRRSRARSAARGAASSSPPTCCRPT